MPPTSDRPVMSTSLVVPVGILVAAVVMAVTATLQFSSIRSGLELRISAEGSSIRTEVHQLHGEVQRMRDHWDEAVSRDHLQLWIERARQASALSALPDFPTRGR